MGLRPGEKIKRLALLEVVSIARERIQKLEGDLARARSMIARLRQEKTDLLAKYE
jgi:hypothetical protein